MPRNIKVKVDGRLRQGKVFKTRSAADKYLSTNRGWYLAFYRAGEYVVAKR